MVKGYLYLIFYAIAWNQIIRGTEQQADVLRPYWKQHTDFKRNHRHVRECQHIIHGNRTFVVHDGFNKTDAPPVESLKYITHKVVERKSVFEIHNRYVHGHIAIINNPLKSFTVLYPRNELSCSEKSGFREKTSVTARMGKCLLATNAGFFDTHVGGCLGNIVSNGHLVHDSRGIQNANFGIRKDGSIVVGYLPEDEVIQEENGFVQLISGVGWLIRDGKIYVNESKKAECADTEETGTIERFFNVISARTAIGHDEHGRIILAQIDGKTDIDGLNLLQFAKLLKKHGAINAINLDGGGSSTFVVNGTVINYPSDTCGNDFSCERKVSTVICIHEPYLDMNCSNPKSECSNKAFDKDKQKLQKVKNATKNEALNTKRKNSNLGDESMPNFEGETKDVKNHPRSFVVVWFVALSVVLGCSLLANIFLLNMLGSKKPKEKSWNNSDLRALLDEDSDGV